MTITWPKYDINVWTTWQTFNLTWYYIDLVTGLKINKFYFHWFNQNETALNLFKWENLNHDSSWSRDPWFLIWYEPSIFILGGSFLHDFFEFSSQAIIVIVFAWKTIMEKCVHTMTFYCSKSFTDESSVMTFPLDQRKFSGSYLPDPLFEHSCRDCENRNSKKI